MKTLIDWGRWERVVCRELGSSNEMDGSKSLIRKIKTEDMSTGWALIMNSLKYWRQNKENSIIRWSNIGNRLSND